LAALAAGFKSIIETKKLAEKFIFQGFNSLFRG
jgi:hypothetical protein